jgi:hypothetical protein
LVNRGVLRDKAREIINMVHSRDNGTATAGTPEGFVEVNNEVYAMKNGWYMDSYEMLRRRWQGHSEF